MLTSIKRFFEKVAADGQGKGETGEHDLLVAVCALFLEMARIDEVFADEEMEMILGVMKGTYGLSAEHAEALMAEADRELEESVDLWRFARRINENYSNEEKIELIETLWRIIYVDGKLDKYEDYLIHKLADLLRLTHPQLIEAKLKVLRSAETD